MHACQNFFFQFKKNQSKINSIRAKLSEEEIIRSAYLNPSGRLYMFGGFSEEGNLNTLHRLNLCTLKWQRIRPDVSDLCSFEPLPCDKNVCWEYDDKFYLFGGYGPVPRIWNENYQFQFIFDHVFDSYKNSLENLIINGEIHEFDDDDDL